MKIAVTGEIRSGKDTFSHYIMNQLGDCKKLYFAEGILEIIVKYFPESFWYGKPRKHFQEIGTFMRTLNPDVWVNYTHLLYTGLVEDNPKASFVATDLRKMNEYEWLKENGFTVVKVEAAEEVRKERIEAAGDIFDNETFLHESERDIRNLPYDYLVTNNDTLESLYEQADFILNELKGEQGR